MKLVNKIVIYFLGLNMIILGFDKFFKFMPEACTLMENAPAERLYVIGVIEILLGVLLFTGKYIRPILIFILLLMVWAIYMHMRTGTDDIGGAIFLGALCLIPIIGMQFVKAD